MNFQILSLSGGGFFGLYTISVLAELESGIGRPIASCFDLLAGTSIGGIIALALAAEIPADQIRDAFEKNGTSVFSSRPVPQVWITKLVDFCRSLSSAKYNGEVLRKMIVQMLGEDTLMGQLDHPVIIPAVNLTKGKPQTFKTDHHPNFRIDHTRKVIDVALATSAAPTYFPLAAVGDELFADGGLYANSPDLIGLHEAEHFFEKKTEDISILSIGSTTSKFSFSHQGGVNLGSFAWARKLPRVLLSSQQLSVKYMLEHKLGSNYLRIDAEQSPEQERDLALDVATVAAQKTIRGLASSSVQGVLNHPTLKQILGRTASQPVFYYRQKPGTGAK
jgi:patatin-like phospholipase/acyl hydrolase